MRLPALAVCSTFFLGLAAHAQSPADFSGTWKMDPSRSESAHQAVPIGPVMLIVKQTGGALTMETRTGETTKAAIANETLTFPLDGSENTLTSASGVPIKAKAHWDGPKLVTETARNVRDSTITTVYVLSLDPSGRELTIDKTLTVQHGYQFQGANNTGTSKDVFVKKREPGKR